MISSNEYKYGRYMSGHKEGFSEILIKEKNEIEELLGLERA